MTARLARILGWLALGVALALAGVVAVGVLACAT